MMGMELSGRAPFSEVWQEIEKRCSPHSTLTHSFFYCRDSLAQLGFDSSLLLVGCK